MSCPPNMLCINYSHTIFLLIILFIITFYTYTRFFNNDNISDVRP